MIESLCSYDGPDGSWSCRLIVARSYRGAKWNLKRDRFMFRWWFFYRILHPMTIIMEMFDYGVILQPWLSRVSDGGKQRRRREITPIHLCNLIKHQSQKQNTGQVPGICFRFNLFINLRCLMSFSSSIGEQRRWQGVQLRVVTAWGRPSPQMVVVSILVYLHVSVQLLLCPCLFCGSFVGHFSVHTVLLVCCAEMRLLLYDGDS